MSQLIRYSSITIDPATRTALTVPVDCNAVNIWNRDVVNDATLYDAASGGNSRPLAAGTSVSYRRQAMRGDQWHAGETIVWAQSAAGTGPILVECLR